MSPVESPVEFVGSSNAWSLTPSGVDFSERLTLPTWRTFLDRITFVESSINWWKGDWFNAGKRFAMLAPDEHHTPEEIRAAISSMLMLSHDQHEHMRQCSWVATQVPRVIRRPTIAWSIHRQVAGLAHPKQTAWLNKVERNEWSVAQLREAMAGASREREQQPLLGFVFHRWKLDGLRWLAQQRIETWSPECRAALKDEAAELIQKLCQI